MRIHNQLCALTFILSWFSSAALGSPILILSPSGTISGAPGTTIGWGFSLTNTLDYLVVTGSDFCEGAPSTPCPHTLGSYTDFIGPNFIVVGPSPESTTVSQAFNFAAITGVGSFSIFSGVSPGSSVVGNIFLTYDLYTLSPNDPNFDPVVDRLSSGNVLTAAASVTVGGSAVPEPSTLLLLFGGCLALVALRGSFAKLQRRE